MPGGYFSYGIVPGNSKVRTAGSANTILSDLGIVALNWELYNFGGCEAQEQAARSDVLVEEARFQHTKYQWKAYTINFYLQLLRLTDLLAIQSQNIQRAVASKDKYKRLKEAATEAGAVAPLDIENALSRMKADEAVVLSEKSNVESMSNIKGYLTITAPFNGAIVQRNVSAGALVGPGSKSNDLPMLVLQHLEKLRLEVYIPEAYVDKVDLKRPVTFVFNAIPGKENKATISRSANALTSLRSEAIEIDVNNKRLELKPGMYAEVKIPLLSEAKSLLIPNNAIVRSTERQYVITVKDGKARLVNIQEGLRTNDSTEVFGELKPGEEILLHATDEIKEGTVIK